MNMIEKVARVIYEFDEGKDSWGIANNSSKSANIRLAKIIIEAMREPTNEMIKAGEPIVYECFSLEPGEGLDENPALPIWEAMINVALKE